MFHHGRIVALPPECVCWMVPASLKSWVENVCTGDGRKRSRTSNLKANNGVVGYAFLSLGAQSSDLCRQCNGLQ